MTAQNQTEPVGRGPAAHPARLRGLLGKETSRVVASQRKERHKAHTSHEGRFRNKWGGSVVHLDPPMTQA